MTHRLPFFRIFKICFLIQHIWYLPFIAFLFLQLAVVGNTIVYNLSLREHKWIKMSFIYSNKIYVKVIHLVVQLNILRGSCHKHAFVWASLRSHLVFRWDIFFRKGLIISGITKQFNWKELPCSQVCRAKWSRIAAWTSALPMWSILTFCLANTESLDV